MVSDDPVNHPSHYTSHPSGVECIQVTEHMGFNVGNAVKYLWRADEKGNALEDLRKAAWYVEREIARRTPVEELCGSTHTVPEADTYVCDLALGHNSAHNSKKAGLVWWSD